MTYGGQVIDPTAYMLYLSLSLSLLLSLSLSFFISCSPPSLYISISRALSFFFLNLSLSKMLLMRFQLCCGATAPVSPLTRQRIRARNREESQLRPIPERGRMLTRLARPELLPASWGTNRLSLNTVSASNRAYRPISTVAQPHHPKTRVDSHLARELFIKNNMWAPDLSVFFFTETSGGRKRRVEFEGGSRHDRNRHNRRNRQNRHGSSLGAVFCRTSKKEGKVLPRTAQNVRTAKAVMKATLLKPNPPFPSS